MPKITYEITEEDDSLLKTTALSFGMSPQQALYYAIGFGCKCMLNIAQKADDLIAHGDPDAVENMRKAFSKYA